MGIPRLDLKSMAAGSRGGGPFRRDVYKKPFRLLIDRHLLASPEWEIGFLRGFDHHPLVEIYVDADSHAPGNFVLGKVDNRSNVLPIRFDQGDKRWTEGGIFPYFQWVRIARSEANETGQPYEPWLTDTLLAA